MLLRAAVISLLLLLFCPRFFLRHKVCILAVEIAVVFCLFKIEGGFFRLGSGLRFVADGAVVSAFRLGGLFGRIVEGEACRLFKRRVGLVCVGVAFLDGLFRRFGEGSFRRLYGNFFRRFGLRFRFCGLFRSRGKRLFFRFAVYAHLMPYAQHDHRVDQLDERDARRDHRPEGGEQVGKSAVNADEDERRDPDQEHCRRADNVKSARMGHSHRKEGKRKVGKHGVPEDEQDDAGDVSHRSRVQGKISEQVEERISFHKLKGGNGKESRRQQEVHKFDNALSLVGDDAQYDHGEHAHRQRQADRVDGEIGFLIVEERFQLIEEGSRLRRVGNVGIGKERHDCDGDKRLDEVERRGAAPVYKQSRHRADEQDGVHADHRIQGNFCKVIARKVSLEQIQQLLEQAGSVSCKFGNKQEYDKARKDEQGENGL